MTSPDWSHRRLQFGDFEIDTQTGELQRDGRTVILPDQLFQVLNLLLKRQGELITREEFCRKLWPANTFIDFDDGLNAAVKRLRLALGDSADNPRFIETIPRRGYRFICHVEEVNGSRRDPSGTVFDNASPAPNTATLAGNENGLPVLSEKSAFRVVHGSALFSSRRRTVFINILIGLFVLGLIVLRPSRRPKLTEHDFILLTDFRNTTGDPAFDETLKRAVSIDLEQSPYLNVYPQEKVRQALKFMGRPMEEPVTVDLGREICQRNGIKALVTGSITKLGTHYVISLEGVDAQSNSLLAQEQAESPVKEEVLKTLGRASRRLREKLGESVASIQQFGRPLEEATTASLDALKMFTLGDIQLSKREDLASIPLYKRAIELDPNFAIAYARLGAADQNIGEVELAHEYMQKAFLLKDRSSEREGLYISAHYYAARGMIQKSVEAYELYKQVYPRDFIPYNNLAIKYLNLEQNDKAIENALGAIRLNPDSTNGYVVAGAAYLGMNQLSDAKAILNSALQQKVDSWSIHELLSRIANLEGDETAVEHENALTRSSPEGDLTLIVRDAGTMASRGQLRKARELYGRAVERAKQLELKDAAADSLLDKALMEAELGYPWAVESSVAEALGLSHSQNVKVGAARVLALAGMHHKALSLINELSKSAPTDALLQSVFVPQVKAIVELRRKNAAQSLQLLGPTSPYDLLDPLGRYDNANFLLLLTRGEAYLHTRQQPEAEHEFQRILSLRKTYNDDCIYPLAVVNLARTYAATGDLFHARSTFQEFFTLWRDADSDNWLLHKVKREYAQLQRRQ